VRDGMYPNQCKRTHRTSRRLFGEEARSARVHGDGPEGATPASPPQGASFLLGEAPPHAGFLGGPHGPFQAFEPDGAAGAHGLGGLDLGGGRTAVPDGEEELGVLVLAESPVYPVHSLTPHIRSRPTEKPEAAVSILTPFSPTQWS
jgi:hypothetical protein